MMQILKIGGNELEKAGFLEGLAGAVAERRRARPEEPLLLVHGGGRAIASLQQRLGLQPQMVEGLRVTDGESLAVAQMVLSGQVNKGLVAALLAAGVPAAGLSGVDGGLLRCVKKAHPSVDLGYVGQVTQVEPRALHGLLAQGLVPVISPISLGLDGQLYNVNADEAAAALAAALGADLLTFLSNVPAVLDPAGRPIARLSRAQSEQLIAAGVIAGGMVPKVRAALGVLEQGVVQARIVDLPGLANGGGTVFTR